MCNYNWHIDVLQIYDLDCSCTTVDYIYLASASSCAAVTFLKGVSM